MAQNGLPEISYLRRRVSYNPETGKLTWLPRPLSDFRNKADWCRWHTTWADKLALNSPMNTGYLMGRIAGKGLLAHRVAFALMEGRWPKFIDHINGVRTDNRWVNLREATPSENLRNCKKTGRNTTGVVGVWRDRKKFSAHIYVERKRYYLGVFPTLEEAAQARKEAERRFGFSERHGL